MTQRFRAVSAATALAGLLSAGAARSSDQQYQAVPLEPISTESRPKVRGVGDPDLVSVIVKLDSPSLAAYKGQIAGLAATNARANGAARLDSRSAAAIAYERHLIQKERAFEDAARARIPSARVTHRYRKILGGVSMTVPRGSVSELKSLPGVQAVYPDSLVALNTDRSPEFIGAPTLWNQVGGQSEAGEGVIVGIVDTGIWPEHPSLADDGTYAAPPAKWTGTACEFGSANANDPPFVCNHKLLGAQRFMATFDTFGPAPLAGEFHSARDNNGHGSHTATTATGNANVQAGFNGTPLAVVSGIAPRAHVVAYKVCFTTPTGQGSCYQSDSVAAIEQAIVDGVDVLNFSIGGGNNPYSDPVELAFLDAYEAGVFVAASAGNDGPTAETTGHRGPWVTTVAASTTDRSFQGSASVASGSDSLTVNGSSVMGPVATSPVVLNTADPLCQVPAAPGTFTGQIVVCSRGVNARVNKGFNVLQGGAVGMILYNPTLNSLNADTHYLPALHIDHIQGPALVAFLTAHPGTTGSLSGGTAVLDPAAGDIMAAFSSRGGPGQTLGVSKPDITGPGVDILAGQTPKLAVGDASPPDQLFQIISGTSMSSPHIAGSAALLKQLHPDWTPGQIKSALMTTATVDGLVKEDGVTPATPFDLGSGRVDLSEAGRPGLTFDATAAEYVANELNLSVVNYPSLYLPIMPGKVTVSRTVKSHLNQLKKWYLSVEAPDDVDIKVPSFLVVPGNGSRTFDITVDAKDVPLGETRHATLLLSTEPNWYCRGWGRHDHGHGPHGDHHHDHPNHIRLRVPITLNHEQAGVGFTKTCSPDSIALRQSTTCTLSLSNTTFDAATVSLRDRLPNELSLQTVTGAVKRPGDLLTFEGVLAGAQPPDVHVAPGPSVAGYLPLSLFGIAPVSGVGDETIANFNVPPFQYAGETYTRIGMVSNGYLVVGGGTGADVQFINQNLPNGAVPNNVLAPFWTDLNAAVAGSALRVGTLTDGVDTWIVFDWATVANYSDHLPNSFEVWIGVNGTEDISFAYGNVTGGDGGFLTVGAENKFGNRGESVYVDGTGTPPTAASEFRVTSTPGTPGETKTITYTAKGVAVGQWTNCAEVKANTVFGTTTACAVGEVTRRPTP